jgi:hypothetical protein
MKRVEFTIINREGSSLREPGFVDHCSELPVAIMRAMEDFMEARGGDLHLPIQIRIEPSEETPSC